MTRAVPPDDAPGVREPRRPRPRGPVDAGQKVPASDEAAAASNDTERAGEDQPRRERSR
ncbi:hypothetical protein [Umezawaea beigongshangensis]|uniref:hypothetical protein n=1 Tax=Umezawaea beigongshangensis TaxID=2780383 RepID=UPI0018F1C680|nr:hypothetical protein [Umezawaea beigongshangensis]